jgi:hypothetical protein
MDCGNNGHHSKPTSLLPIGEPTCHPPSGHLQGADGFDPTRLRFPLSVRRTHLAGLRTTSNTFPQTRATYGACAARHDSYILFTQPPSMKAPRGWLAVTYTNITATFSGTDFSRARRDGKDACALALRRALRAVASDRW